MRLSETDRREVCQRCGWVGRRAFQEDRHDLCEPPLDESLPDDEDLDDEEDPDVDTIAEGSDTASAEDEAEPRWSRASARQRGIPSKKTLAVRRITQLELAAGRAELRALGGDEPYTRPKTRGDCRWCHVCQSVRDGKSNGLDSTGSRAFVSPEVNEEHGTSSSAELEKRSLPPRTKKPSGAGGMELDGRDRGTDHHQGVLPPGRLACGHRIVDVIQHSRPCVFVACKHSLYLDVSETGSIILNFPHLEPGQMSIDRSCSLDLADRGAVRGPMTLEEIAIVTNLTRERIRQVELKALIRHARPAAVAMGLGHEDAAAIGGRRHVGPSADLEETGVEGAVPSDVATILSGNGWDG